MNSIPGIEREKIEKKLSKVLKGDFWELRYEAMKTHNLSIKEANIIGDFEEFSGFFIRYLKDSYWHTFSSNSLEETFQILKSKNISTRISSKKALGFKESIPIKYESRSNQKISEVENTQTILDIHDIADSINRYHLEYTSLLKSKTNHQVYLNSEGTILDYENHDFYAGIKWIKADRIFSSFFGSNSTIDKTILCSFNEECHLSYSDIYQYLLFQLQNKISEKTVVVLSPSMSCLLIHEIIGHSLEADVQLVYPALQDVFALGKKISNFPLKIVDSTENSNLRGFIPCDDEGVGVKKVTLVKDGKVEGRMHTRETASVFDESLTGNGRAINYKFPPICRMRNTILTNQGESLEYLLKSIKSGIYVDSPYGGYPNFQNLTFSINCLISRRILDGKFCEALGPLRISGKIPDVLNSIIGIADIPKSDSSSYGCGKSGQSYLPVGQMAPYLLVNRLKCDSLIQ